MKLNEANIIFRPRTDWEAIDLGFKLAAKHRIKLFFLWLSVSLPFILLITALSWRNPSRAFLLIWWLKPVFEYSTLYVLSIAVFESPPPFKNCLKQAFRLIFNKHLIGDLTWRRLSPYRAVNLPIRQLEQLSAKAYKTRARVLDHQVSNGGMSLIFLSANIELILFCGISAFLWMSIHASPGDALVQNHASFLQAIVAMRDALEQYQNNVTYWEAHLYNIVYGLILSFWGPIYVASGFTTYLNARSKLEAWDVELTFRRLAQRISSSLFMVLACALVLLTLPAAKSYAEPLPDEATVIQQRDKIVNQTPSPTLKTKREWCFITCDKEIAPPPLTQKNLPLDRSPGLFGNAFRIIMWAGLAAVLIIIIYFLFRDPSWMKNLTSRQKTAPKVLFGMDVTPESLPDDVATEARKLFDTNPRAALSLLYRASLTQLIHHYDLPIRKGHTEHEILNLTATHAAATFQYMSHLTEIWIDMAYGHTQPPAQSKNTLCQGYRQTFALTQNAENTIGGTQHYA